MENHRKMQTILPLCLLLFIAGCSKTNDSNSQNTVEYTSLIYENMNWDSTEVFEKEIQEKYPEFEKHDVYNSFILNYNGEKSVIINVYNNNKIIYQLFRMDRDEKEPKIKFCMDLAFNKQLNTVQYTGYWKNNNNVPINRYNGSVFDLEQDIRDIYVATVNNLQKEDVQNYSHFYLTAVSFDHPFDETNLQKDIENRIKNGDLIITLQLDY